MVQLFFAWRVKVLTGNLWLVSLIGIAAMGSVCTTPPIALNVVALSLQL